jgi:hypothetical protein
MSYMRKKKAFILFFVWKYDATAGLGSKFYTKKVAFQQSKRARLSYMFYRSVERYCRGFFML